MAPISQHVKEKLKYNETIEKYIIMRDRTSLHHSTVRKSTRKKGKKKREEFIKQVIQENISVIIFILKGPIEQCHQQNH